MFLKYDNKGPHLPISMGASEQRYNSTCDLLTLLFNLKVLDTQTYLPRVLSTLSPRYMDIIYQRTIK